MSNFPIDIVGSLFTWNRTNQRVWITIYDLAKTQHLDYGFMEAASAMSLPGGISYPPIPPNVHVSGRRWTSGGYYPPGFYHARGEVKDADNNTIFDTEIELGPALYSTYLETDNSGNYWWVAGF